MLLLSLPQPQRGIRSGRVHTYLFPCQHGLTLISLSHSFTAGLNKTGCRIKEGKKEGQVYKHTEGMLDSDVLHE